jgi:hypothetical protein
VPENLFPPRSKDTNLSKFFITGGKHPMKLLFARCTYYSEELLVVDVGTSPTNALLEKSM